MGFGNNGAEELQDQMDKQIQDQNAQIQEKLGSISQERLRIIKSQGGAETWYNPPLKPTKQPPKGK